MKHFALFYDYTPDFRERRAPHRALHLEHAAMSVARGELQLAGAFAEDDPPMGLLLFTADSPDPVEAFARADPYVVHGVVERWRVREWVTVVGPQALNRV